MPENPGARGTARGRLRKFYQKMRADYGEAQEVRRIATGIEDPPAWYDGHMEWLGMGRDEQTPGRTRRHDSRRPGGGREHPRARWGLHLRRNRKPPLCVTESTDSTERERGSAKPRG